MRSARKVWLNQSCAQPEKDGSANHAFSQRRMAQPIMRSAREGWLSQLGDIWLSVPLLRSANHALS